MIHLRVKEIASNSGLSLKEVCEKAGYKSLPSFYRQINNPETINMKTLIRISETLGVPIYELFVDGEDLVMSVNYDPHSLICPKCGTRFRLVEESNNKNNNVKKDEHDSI